MILIIDDDRFLTNALERSLCRKDYRVIIANSSDKAVKTLKEYGHEIDIVLLDVMMRRGKEFSEIEAKGGWETGICLGIMIREKYPHIKTYGMTGGDSEEVKSWFSENTDGFLLKPFSARFEDLFAMLEGHQVEQNRISEEILEIKPNFYGIGINLRALFRRLRNR